MSYFKNDLQAKLELTISLIQNNPSDIDKYIHLFEQEIRDELARFNLLANKSFVEDFLHKRAIAEISDNFKKFVVTMLGKANSWVEIIERKDISVKELEVY